jgi:hypothetical protein
VLSDTARQRARAAAVPARLSGLQEATFVDLG